MNGFPIVRTGREVVEWLAERIIHVGELPIMYCGSAAGVGLILLELHRILAFCLGIEGELQVILDDLYRRERCGAMDFATRYRHGPRGRPDASEIEVAQYVVNMWRVIGDRLVPDLFREMRGRLDAPAPPANPD